MAGTSPVPLAAIAKQDVHTQHPLDADFSFVQPAWHYFLALRHSNLSTDTIIESLPNLESYVKRDPHDLSKKAKCIIA
jgi:hypothetical protein